MDTVWYEKPWNISKIRYKIFSVDLVFEFILPGNDNKVPIYQACLEYITEAYATSVKMEYLC